jgi:hypothetical protein
MRLKESTSNLKTEAAFFSDKLVSAHETTRCLNSEGLNLNNHRRENSKTYNKI